MKHVHRAPEVGVISVLCSLAAVKPAIEMHVSHVIELLNSEREEEVSKIPPPRRSIPKLLNNRDAIWLQI